MLESAWGGSALGGGVWSWVGGQMGWVVVCCRGGVSGPGGGGLLWGVLSGGVCSLGVSGPGGCVPQHALRQTPPLQDRILDTRL